MASSLPLASSFCDQYADSSRYNDAQNSVFLFQKAWSIGNASVGYEPASAKWSVRLFVDNITDERYIVSGDSNYGIGFHEAEYNRPREWGIAGKVSF
jgi:iron complex outermembrane receptor protein